MNIDTNTDRILNLDWIALVADTMMELIEYGPVMTDAEINVMGEWLDWCVNNDRIGEA